MCTHIGNGFDVLIHKLLMLSKKKPTKPKPNSQAGFPVGFQSFMNHIGPSAESDDIFHARGFLGSMKLRHYPVLLQLMEIGVIGVSGANVQQTVVEELRPEAEPAVTLHQLMEGQNAWEMLLKRKLATTTPVRVILLNMK